MIELLTPENTPWSVDWGAVPAAGESSVSELLVWHERDAPGGAPLRDAWLAVSTEDPTRPGVGVAAGLPPQSELWVLARITAINTAGAPQQQVTSEWQRLGAYRSLQLPSLLAGNAVELEIKVRPPSTAAGVPWALFFDVVAEERSRTLPLPAVPRPGILTGYRDAARTSLVRGGAVVPNEPPDANVTVLARHWIRRGVPFGATKASLELDQEAADGTLGAGQHYYATISQTSPASTPTLTKGNRDAIAPPAPPAGEIVLANVRVDYNAVASEIDETAIVDRRLLDRFNAEPGTGLELLVHPGQAWAGSTYRVSRSIDAVPLVAESESWIYLLESGLFDASASFIPPNDAAVGPLWRVVTDETAITELEDLRAFAASAAALVLQGAIPGSPGEIASVYLPSPVYLDDVVCSISDIGGGTDGVTTFDLELDAVTLYTSSATDDQRPSFPFDTAVLAVRGGIAERVRVGPGTLVLRSVEHPAGGAAPASVHVTLFTH